MVVNLTVNVKIALQDAADIATARTMQLMKLGRDRGTPDWRVPRELTRMGLVQDIRTAYLNLGAAAGLRAQIEQRQLMDELGLTPTECMLAGVVAHERVLAVPMTWGGDDSDHRSTRVRLSFRMEPDALVRMLTARMLGRMHRARERDAALDWYRLDWRRALSRWAMRDLLGDDLRAYGVAAPDRADEQIRLCTDSMPLFYACEVPAHVLRICQNRVAQVYGP